MRVTFLLPFAGLAGGVRVVAIYAERLKARGHQVTVVSTPRRVPTIKNRVGALVRRGEWLRGPHHEPSHFDHLDVEHHVIDAPRPIVDDDVPDADVVVATFWTTAEALAALSSDKGAKAYFLQHDETVMSRSEADRVVATWKLPLHKITISDWLVKLAAERAGDTRVSLIPNSVDMHQFHAPPRGKQQQPTVGFLYSRQRFKACDVALAAFERLRARLPDAQLLAFGAVRPSPELPLPESAAFSFQPEQARLKDLYAACDVWLCGSLAEGFHLPPLEAMACRCPVVSTRVGGPMDIIEDGRNGYLVDVGDSDALADRLEHVLTRDEDRWRALSDGAYETASGYTWDDATTRFEAALQQAIERTGAGELVAD